MSVKTEVFKKTVTVGRMSHQAATLGPYNYIEEYNALAEAETAKCPNGYNYGSKWLVEPLPREVMDRITSIFNKYVEVV